MQVAVQILRYDLVHLTQPHRSKVVHCLFDRLWILFPDDREHFDYLLKVLERFTSYCPHNLRHASANPASHQFLVLKSKDKKRDSPPHF